MSKRISVMIDEDIDRKLRHAQAKMIQHSMESYSYSKAVNDILRKSFN